MYGQIIVPPAVFNELVSHGAPSKVRDLITKSPDWLVTVNLRGSVDSSIAHLDPGEREAIQLAVEIDARLLLVDDLEGRYAAEKMGLKIVGLIGVLNAAKQNALIDVDSVITRLRNTNFLSPTI